MPIWCQSGAKLMPMHPYPAGANPSQSDVNPMPIQRQSCSHHVSTYLNLMSIWCRSSANLMPIHPNPIPILYQSDVKSMPIQCQTFVQSANDHPIQCQPYYWNQMSILDQSANPMLIHCKSTQIRCQPSADLSLSPSRCQSMSMSAHHQNSTQISILHQ